MRLLLALAAYAALTVSGFAQALREVPLTESIHLAPGQVRAFTINRPFTDLYAPDISIVDVQPEGDQSFSIRAIAPGNTVLTLKASDGTVVLRSPIVVGGNSVKIYGTRRGGDYLGFVCTEFTCSRADPDKKIKDPTSMSITTRDADGNIITTQY